MVCTVMELEKKLLEDWAGLAFMLSHTKAKTKGSIRQGWNPRLWVANDTGGWRAALGGRWQS